jgi:hypothetical protein
MSSSEKYQRTNQRLERTRPQTVKIKVPMIYGGRRGSNKLDYRWPPFCWWPVPYSTYSCFDQHRCRWQYPPISEPETLHQRDPGNQPNQRKQKPSGVGKDEKARMGKISRWSIWRRIQNGGARRCYRNQPSPSPPSKHFSRQNVSARDHSATRSPNCIHIHAIHHLPIASSIERSSDHNPECIT